MSLKDLQKALTDFPCLGCENRHLICDHCISDNILPHWRKLQDLFSAFHAGQVAKERIFFEKEHSLRNRLKELLDDFGDLEDYDNDNVIELVNGLKKVFDETFSEVKSCESCLFLGCTEGVCLNCGKEKHHWLPKVSEEVDKGFVHVPRKQLSDLLDNAELEIKKRNADDEDFLSFEDNRDHIFYAGEAVGKRDLLKELLEAFVSGDCPKLITPGFWCGQHPSRLCKDIINTKGCTWGTDSK